MSSSKIISSTKWVLGTIILGALGSGLWELLISDLFSWLSLTSLELASHIFSGFRDDLYKGVSDGAVVSFLKLPATLIAIAMVMVPVFLFLRIFILSSFYQNDDEQAENGQSKKRFITSRRFLASTMAIIIVTYFSIAFRYIYTAKAANFIEKSVDILAPHISVEKRLNLISNYKSIVDSSDYINVYSELRKLEKKHQVTLPDFEPI
ncbi:hypothetical protein [Alteromonas sp. BMJM2]|uniref:hypothetical protein n=1 Tax=Alteromonas sp. BMJM2 TaxID=2954241 RepID=UPI0022B4AB84|nr:hypothetical protein [Alteromonas sp. BMJM2]